MVFRRGAGVAVVIVVAGVCALAVFSSPVHAVAALALALAGAAALRALTPTSLLACARSRAFDVVFMLLLAASLGYLSLWGDATFAPG